MPATARGRRVGRHPVRAVATVAATAALGLGLTATAAPAPADAAIHNTCATRQHHMSMFNSFMASARFWLLEGDRLQAAGLDYEVADNNANLYLDLAQEELSLAQAAC